MPSHACIDPYDPYAQAEVVVAFERTQASIRLLSVVDPSDNDILADLEDIERQALVSEILASGHFQPQDATLIEFTGSRIVDESGEHSLSVGHL